MPSYNGKHGHAPPAAVVDPVTGTKRTGLTGVLAAQAAQLGSAAQFAQQTPQFDGEWKQHVERCIAAYRIDDSEHEMDEDIAPGDILTQLQRLKNGKAASSATGIPNELLKYGGEQMATMLTPLFKYKGRRRGQRRSTDVGR